MPRVQIFSSSSGLKVYVDNNPVNFDLIEDSSFIYITLTYDGGPHKITIAKPLTYLGLEWWLWVIIIAIAVISLIVAILIIRKRYQD